MKKTAPFNPVWVIQKKRDGHALSESEINDFVGGILSGQVKDYQASAWLMATTLKGMTTEETTWLTRAMLESGKRYDLSDIPGAKVDKHSTGGVGDKVSIILAPLAAACGISVPMMSGRGLGHSGGTLDKLEAIPGFRTGLDENEFRQTLRTLGCAMIGQSRAIAPVDRILYALRDVTATVECVPLITASIISKKAAEGTDGLVLDVKTGSGAFMKSLPEAKRLAASLALVGKQMGLKCRALITNMHQPLGYAVGNALEIRECMEVLKGETRDNESSADLKELTLQLCAHMLHVGGRVKSLAEGRKLATENLRNGTAWTRFKHLVHAQGGSVAAVEGASTLEIAPETFIWKAPKKGYLNAIDTEAIGKLLVLLGGGRMNAEEPIDASVGLTFHRKLGALLKAGDAVVTVHYRLQTVNRSAEAIAALNFQELLGRALIIASTRKTVPKLVFGQY